MSGFQPTHRIVLEVGGVMFGWKIGEHSRLHLKALSGPDDCLVFLETQEGEPTWDPVTPIPQHIEDDLGFQVALHREEIETAWVKDHQHPST